MRRVAKRWRLGIVNTLKLLPSGTTHVVYFVGADRGDYAFRIATLADEARDPGTLHRKELLWRAVGRWGVGPRYHGGVCEEVAGVPVFIGRFDWVDAQKFHPARDAIMLAVTLAKSHMQGEQHVSPYKRAVDYTQFIRDRLQQYAAKRPQKALERLLREESLRALSLLSRSSDTQLIRPALVHGDLVDQNILTALDRVALVDWDWAIWTTPTIDLYCFLSPFVRGWEQPRLQPDSVALEFLTAYSLEYGPERARAPLSRDYALWWPYNVILANWLYYDCPRPQRHHRDLRFYEKGFANVERLDSLIWICGREALSAGR